MKAGREIKVFGNVSIICDKIINIIEKPVNLIYEIEVI